MKPLTFLLCLLLFPILSQAQDHHHLAGVDQVSLEGINTINYAHVMDVEIKGDRAYACVGVYNGLETYDISNPKNPTLLTSSGPAAWGAKAYGDQLYVFHRKYGFSIHDIKGSTPVKLGGYNPPNSSTLYENGVLSGNTLYVAAFQKGIYSFDVSNPGNPVLQKNILLQNNACWDLELHNNCLIVANGRHGLSVVDLVSPNPTEIAVLPLPGLTNHIVLDQNVAVLSLGTGGIATVDIATPQSPVLLDRARSKGNAFGSGIHDHKVVVGAWSVMEVFDISDPSRIKKIGWDHTKTWSMGADAHAFGNDTLLVSADWLGVSVYLLKPDGPPDIEVSPTHLDFGQVTIQETRTVEVKNSGLSPLDVTVTGIPSGIMVNPSAFTVAPGTVKKLRVQATGSGNVDKAMKYQSNDPDEPSFTQYVYKNNSSFPQMDSKAVDFTLQDNWGYWHTLSDYVGRPVYLEFSGMW